MKHLLSIILLGTISFSSIASTCSHLSWDDSSMDYFNSLLEGQDSLLYKNMEIRSTDIQVVDISYGHAFEVRINGKRVDLNELYTSEKNKNLGISVGKKICSN